MGRNLRRTVSLLAAILLSLTLATSAAAVSPTAPAPTASPLETRLQELERRLAALERALALSTIDVPAVVQRATPAVVSLYQVTEDHDVLSEGTGFLWSEDGMIITNAHVVDEPGATVLAKFTDGEIREGRRILVDDFLDLAILDVEGTGYPYLELAPAKPPVGSPVVVIGNAFGYSNSVTFGIVSGVDRPSPYHAIVHYPSLQTDAAINHGNSGGPILNAAGEVVAVATWTEGKEETDGIAFGIPADQVMAALERADTERGIIRPWLGISVQEPYWARGGLPNDLGLMITDLHPEGAGARAGLEPYDYIMQVNGVPVNYLLDLRRELEKAEPGSTVTITVERLIGTAYEEITIPVVAGEYSRLVEPLIPYQRYDPATDDIF